MKTTRRYEYTIKDHLGNARISFTDLNANGVVNETNVPATNEVLQENHYYPFGLNTEGPWMNDAALDNKYQYNGKEWNDDFGLNIYPYGARWYDPSIGRFIGVDPISDKFPHVSTFNYAENEPVGSIDLWGLQRLIVNNSYRLSAAPGWMQNTSTVGASLKHPIAAQKVGQFKSGSTNITSVSSRIARHAAIDGQNLSTGIGSERNALRHAIWSATINQEFGASTSKDLTNAHEGIGIAASAKVDFYAPFKGDMSLADDVVDFLNNEIGRSITTEGGNLSSIEIATKTLEVFKDEGLYTAKVGEDGNVTIQRTKITQEQYDESIKVVNQLNKQGFSPEEQKKQNEKK